MEIDVRKCEHYRNGGCANDHTEFECCSKNNCTYKQLQQLKAELQAYKDKVKSVNFVDSYEYLKVVVENKQLKAENDKYKTVLDEIEEIVEQYSNNGIELSVEKQEQILQLIKQAKEVEE